MVHRDIRRQLLRRFPYGLFYRLLQGQVVVVACFHAKRSPRVWELAEAFRQPDRSSLTGELERVVGELEAERTRVLEGRLP